MATMGVEGLIINNYVYTIKMAIKLLVFISLL